MRTSSLQFKVLVFAAAALGFAAAVSYVSIHRVYGTTQDLDRIAREDFLVQTQIQRASAVFREQLQEYKNVLLRGRQAAALETHWKAFEALEKEAAALAREARSASPNEEVRSRLEGFLAAHKAAGERFRQGLAAFRAAGFDPAAGDQAVEGVAREPARLLEEAGAKAEEIGSAAVFAAVKAANNVYWIAVSGIAIAMLLALAGLWYYVRRAVLAPIGTSVRIAERIAQGDLTAEIRAGSRDEAGQLLAALATMNGSLAKVVHDVRAAADNVVTASNQVAAGTTDLSQRTEEQASSLEETAASMEELASTVKQNADNARQADELARNASKRAEQGGSEIVHVVTTMGDISASARRISDIIAVIDGIAFQTNILALNAAVEAARAGEQGRGFAVVASEVRALAQRSAQAAKEIKDLIGNSVAKVEDGTRLVEQAGDTIQALVIDVKRVSDLMGSIAEASAEQARGVQQVNRTVTEMDKVVQQNASVVQQSSAAAEDMRRQAETLVRAVSAFRLNGAAERRVDAAQPVMEVAPVAPPPAARPIAPVRAAPALTARKQPVAAGHDDWEEF